MKKKDDRLGSDPFENVLTHLSDSRKKKENDVNSANDDDANDAKSNNNNTDKNINNDSDTDKDNIRNNSRNKVRNNDNDTAKNKNIVVVSDSSSDNAEITSTVNSNGNAGVSNVDNVESVSPADSNFINISKKQKKTDGYVRVSTYLLPAQVKAIEDLQKKTGRDKGELYRMAVNILIERARVE